MPVGSLRSQSLPEHVLAGSILFLILSAVTPEIWFRGNVLSTGDVPDQFLPWREFLCNQLSEGRIPLWNRFTFCGAPFLANMQSCVLYPIDRAIDLILSPARALAAGVFLHVWMGGYFLYGLARTWGAGQGPAFLVAAGYALGGFNAIHFLGGNLLTITSSSYLAGHLWMVTVLSSRFARGDRAGWIPSAGVVLIAFQILSGHAQMTFYGAVFVTVFVVAGLLMMEQGRIRLLLTLVGMGGLAALIAAPQILATVEYSGFSSRTGSLPYEAATEFSFGWEFLLTLFLPEYLGTRADLFTSIGRDTFWGDWKNWSAVYVGVAPCLGFLGWSLYALSRRRRFSAALPLLALMGTGLFLALGRNNPLYEWVHALPGFGQFRAPSKFLPGFVVPFCVLGAVGLTQVGAVLSGQRVHGRFSRGLLGAAAGCGALGLFAALTGLASAESPIELVFRDLVKGVSASSLLVSGYLLLGSGVWKGRGPRCWLLAAGLFAALDLGPYFSKYLIADAPERLRLFPVEFLKSHVDENERVHTTPEIPQLNQAVPAGIMVTGGYDPFQIGAFVDAMRASGAFEEGQIPDAWTPPPQWASELGAKYLLTTMPIQHPDFKPLAREHPWSLYEVVNAKPLVEFIPEAGSEAERGLGGVEAQWVGDDLHIRGDLPVAGSILIRQVYYPGWKVDTLGGVVPGVTQAPPFWQELRVERGPLNVVFRYRPLSWTWGLQCGIAGLVLFGFLLIGALWSGWKHRGEISH